MANICQHFKALFFCLSISVHKYVPPLLPSLPATVSRHLNQKQFIVTPASCSLEHSSRVGGIKGKKGKVEGSEEEGLGKRK